MKHTYQQIDPALADYVRTVLVVDYDTKSTNSDLPFFTNGMPALFCRTNNDNHHIELFGKSIPNDNWTNNLGETLIAFFFKPFSLGPLFNLSAKELKDRPIPLKDWNAQKSRMLNSELENSQSVNDIVQILNRFILTQLQLNKSECDIIQYSTSKLLAGSNHDVSSELLNELPLTERTFQRMFKKYVGVAPNQYRRICQFHFAFSQLKGGNFNKLTDVAFTNGYYDQSHYIRSFKEFTKTTPKVYLQNGLTQED